MKWKLAVRANWSRDRNSGFTSPSFPPLGRLRVDLPSYDTTRCAVKHHTNGMIPRIWRASKRRAPLRSLIPAEVEEHLRRGWAAIDRRARATPTLLAHHHRDGFALQVDIRFSAHIDGDA